MPFIVDNEERFVSHPYNSDYSKRTSVLIEDTSGKTVNQTQVNKARLR